MRMHAILAASAILLATAGQAQQTRPTIVAEGGEPDGYASARILYWNRKTDSAAGQFAINYGRPTWKKVYEDPAQFDPLTKGKVWRMGSNFWTNLDTQLSLNIGGKEVPAGYYYVGLHRSPDGSQWNLAFIDPAAVRQAHLDAFQIEKAQVKFEAPMSIAKAEGRPATLTITLSHPKDDIKNVTLRVAWGTLALTAPVKVQVPE